MRLIFVGPPGAGKGTHAARLAERHRIPHISTGEILREKIREGSKIGLLAKSYVDQGRLVPDEVILEIIRQRLNEPDAGRGFVLDGFPRTLPQAEAFQKMAAEGKKEISAVVDFVTSREMIVSRLVGRRSCSQCGAIYHLRNIPPKKEGICDRCSGRLVARPDDSEETVMNRLDVYDRETAPLIEYYRGLGLLEEISGDEDIPQVVSRLDEIIERRSRAERKC